MKALTIWQPWASLVATGAKRIETRSWPTSHLGELAIHSAAIYPQKHRDLLRTAVFSRSISMGTRLPLGAILGTVRVLRVLPIPTCGLFYVRKFIEEQLAVTRAEADRELQLGDYTAGRFAWILGEASPLKTPHPCRGKQKLWTAPERRRWGSVAADSVRYCRPPICEHRFGGSAEES
jgi:hypothetical protein